MSFQDNAGPFRTAQVSLSGSSDPHREFSLPAATLRLRHNSPASNLERLFEFIRFVLIQRNK